MVTSENGTTLKTTFFYPFYFVVYKQYVLQKTDAYPVAAILGLCYMTYDNLNVTYFNSKGTETQVRVEKLPCT